MKLFAVAPSTLYIAIRPKTLIAALSPVLIGGKWAAQEGFFDLFLFFCTLVTALGVQVITNLVNDLYDFLKGADTPLRKGPKRVIQSGLMTPKELRLFLYTIAAITIVASIPLILKGGWIIGSLFALALLLAWAYTAGPFPLAYLGLGEIVVLIFFGPVATAMTVFLQMGTFSYSPFLLGFGPGALSCAILILNNLRDQNEDALAQKRTFIVRLNTAFKDRSNSLATWIYKGMYALALLLPISLIPLFVARPLWVYLSYPLPALLVIYRLFLQKDPQEYRSLFEQTIRLHLLYTLAVFISL